MLFHFLDRGNEDIVTKVIVLTRGLLCLVHQVRAVVQGIIPYVAIGETRMVIASGIGRETGTGREIDAMIAIGVEQSRVGDTEIHHFVH